MTTETLKAGARIYVENGREEVLHHGKVLEVTPTEIAVKLAGLPRPFRFQRATVTVGELRGAPYINTSW